MSLRGLSPAALEIADQLVEGNGVRSVVHLRDGESLGPTGPHARSTMATPASRAGRRCSGRMGFAGVGRFCRSTTSWRSGMSAPSTLNRHGSYSGDGSRHTSHQQKALDFGRRSPGSDAALGPILEEPFSNERSPM